MEQTTLPNGLRVAHVNPGETRFLYDEIFTARRYLPEPVALAPGDVVVDVGANIGLATLFLALEEPEITVLAYEPVAVSYEALVANIAAYGLRASAYQCAVGRRAGAGTMLYFPNNSACSTLRVDDPPDGSATARFLENRGVPPDRAAEMLEFLFGARETISCTVTTVSDIVEDHSLESIGLLKIDVEGSECDVLRGIRSADWPKIRQLVIEVHGEDALSEITGILGGRGFRVAAGQHGDLTGTALWDVTAVRPAEAVPPMATRRRAAGARPAVRPRAL